MPDWRSGSSADPLRYQTMWVTTGVRWSGIATTSRPLSRVKDDTSRPPPSVRPNEAPSVRRLVAASDIVDPLDDGRAARTGGASREAPERPQEGRSANVRD